MMLGIEQESQRLLCLARFKEVFDINSVLHDIYYNIDIIFLNDFF